MTSEASEYCTTKMVFTKWSIEDNKEVHAAAAYTVRASLEAVMKSLNKEDDNKKKPAINIGDADPSYYPCFRTTSVAEDAVADAVRSGKFNCYAPAVGILPARRSVAEHLSRELPYKLTADDVFLTVGANHAIEVVLEVLARPGGNILLPRPGYPFYDARAKYSHLEVRHYDLVSKKGWEIDFDGMEALADDKTVAIVIINPGNPCANILTYEHLQKVAEISRKHGILVIADEAYSHLAFGGTPFIPMGSFGSIVPVLTLGMLSKRWITPGWRFGWIAVTDTTGILGKFGISESIKSYLTLTADPATIVQAAIPQILEKTNDSFFININKLLKEAADMLYKELEEIPAITCPHKPQGSMNVLVKLNLSFLDDIHDDMDFCTKLAKEESVITLPGASMGMKNWFRITFAVEPKTLANALQRMKTFCLRHAKKI